MARFEKISKMTVSGCSRKVLAELAGPTRSILQNLPLPLSRKLVTASANDWWEILFHSNTSWAQLRHVYLQVNALSEWIIGIYLHEFTNNERLQVNPDNSREMSALTFLLFKLNTLQTKFIKIWVARSHGVMTVVYWIYTTIMTSRKLFRHKPVSRGTNQPIRKSEFKQCMKFE